MQPTLRRRTGRKQGFGSFPHGAGVTRVPHLTNVRHVTDVPGVTRTGHGLSPAASDGGSCQM
ncbi:hypothetical protein GCM10010260_11640 [Streptomyces filipinensis]|uniref:Uncharacterized protein n=1 Tax=Streptomyces filipinensis TaxID=66887 RepID=A0A918M9S5_9ACTN|nr:hypothetical protein GCM10010260_11640 [Streptomyces filipinensis]